MKTKQNRSVLLLTGLAFALGPQALADELKAPKTTEASPVSSTPEWKLKMQGLYHSLSDLLTDVSSDQRYFDSKNATRIGEEIKSISQFSHSLKATGKNRDQVDPTLVMFSGFLESETNEAARSFKLGYLSYAREILRTIPGDCLACHTRNNLGPDFNSLPLEPTGALEPLEKANFFAATRQFDRAIESFQGILSGKSPVSLDGTKIDGNTIESSIRNALLIAVRYKRDPALALSLVQATIDNPTTPQYLKDDAESWKKSIAAWKIEGDRKASSEAGLHAEALRLIARAHSKQSYPMDHSQDIEYLRASTVLYDLIQLAPNGRFASETFMSLGMCQELLSPRRMETLHNVYYEACIEKAPHTDTARACYKRYEQSMYLGFTGSSGMHLPEEIQHKLSDLWAKASKAKIQ